MAPTYVHTNTPSHKLTGVTVSVFLDLEDGTVRLEHVYGKSSTTKGVLWISNGDDPIALDDEPYAFSTVGTSVAEVLERVAHFRPNTQERFDFTEAGGLHAMDPLF